MKILLTAFEPFGGESVNPAQEAVQRVHSPEGVTLVRLTVPTEFEASMAVTQQALCRERPDAVLCIGQAGGRAQITVERVAINVMDARIPDNSGAQPVDEPIVPGAPAAYFSTLPIKPMVAAMRAAGIPAAVSNTAGTYVCNRLFYGVLHALQEEGRAVPAGFVHVPYLPSQVTEQADKPSMALEMITAGIECALAVLAGRISRW